MSAEPATKPVLIVEDATIIRTMLKNIFAAQGFACLEASSGDEAIKLYNTERPDLVTLDIHIDRLSGLSVLQVLRNLDPSVRVIVISVEPDRHIIEEVIRQGAKAFVAKPFEPEVLQEAIAVALQ